MSTVLCRREGLALPVAGEVSGGGGEIPALCLACCRTKAQISLNGRDAIDDVHSIACLKQKKDLVLNRFPTNSTQGLATVY